MMVFTTYMYYHNVSTGDIHSLVYLHVPESFLYAFFATKVMSQDNGVELYEQCLLNFSRTLSHLDLSYSFKQGLKFIKLVFLVSCLKIQLNSVV